MFLYLIYDICIYNSERSAVGHASQEQHLLLRAYEASQLIVDRAKKEDEMIGNNIYIRMFVCMYVCMPWQE
jgi:hypothetical protein